MHRRFLRLAALAPLAWGAALPGAARAAHQRYNHTSTLLPDGNVMNCGGNDASGAFLDTCNVFVATAGFVASNFPFGSPAAARALHSAAALPDGRVLFSGGSGGGGALATALVWNPATQGWTDVSAGFSARANHTATLLNSGKVLVVGGDLADAGGTSLATTLLFDPSNNSWAAGPSLPASFARSSHTATLLANGRVLVTGGYSSASADFLNDSRVYDPAANAFFPAPPLNVKRAGQSAVVLGSRKVLIVGGFNGIDDVNRRNRGFLKVTEVYDPTADTMVLGPNLHANLAKHASSIWPDGRAFAFGGLGTVDLARFDNQPLILKANAGNAVNFADYGPTDPTQVLKNVTGGKLTAASGSGFTVDLGVQGLSGRILGGVLDVSSAAISVSSGVFYLTSNRPDLNNNPVALCAPGGYCPGLRAELSGLSVLNGRLSSDGISPTVSELVLTISDGSNNSNNRVINSTGPFLNSANPANTLAAVDLDGKSFTVVTASVTITSMVVTVAEEFDPAANVWKDFNPDPSKNCGGVRDQTALPLPSSDFLEFGGRITDASALGAGVCRMIEKPWTASSSMKAPRANHTLTALPDGRPVAVGGTNGASVLDSAELLEGSAWRLAAGRMASARDLHTAILLPNGRVLVAGGFSTSSISTGATSACELYDPKTDRFYPTGPMLAARYNHAAVLLPDGNVLAAGGQTGSAHLNSAEVYISTKGVWEPAGSFTMARALHTANLLQNGAVLIAGGTDGIPRANADLYIPPTRTWTPMTSMTKARHSHSANTLPGNLVAVAGGNDGAGETDSVEIFTPFGQSRPDGSGCGAAGGCWDPHLLQAATSKKALASYSHTATLTPDGKVTWTGGEKVLTGVLPGTEIFDIVARSSFSATSLQQNLSGRRKFHAAALLPSGNILVTGGFNGASVVDTAETSYYNFSPDARRPVLTGVTPSLADRGGNVTFTGSNFLGANGESSSGYGFANSANNLPRVLLQAADTGGTNSQQTGGYLLDLSARVYSAIAASGDVLNRWSLAGSSLTFSLPADSSLPYGWYQARVQSAAQASASTPFQVGPPLPSGTPSAVSPAVLGTSSVSWTWNRGSLTAGTFDGYEVYRATSGIFLSTVAAGAAPAFPSTFTLTGLAPNTTVSILVAGFSLTGIGPLAAAATTFTLAEKPVNLTISSRGASTVRLEWGSNGNPPATVYEVSQSTDDFVVNFSTPFPQSFALSTTAVTVSNLLQNTTYFFRVKAFNFNGIETQFSNTASTRTASTPVGDVTGSALSATTIFWTWPPASGAVQYRVYQSSSMVLVGTPPGGSNNFLEVNLGTNTRHSVMVSAVTDSGEGPLSSAATAFTLAAPPLPQSPVFANVSTGGFTALWADGGNPFGTTYRATAVKASDSSPVLTLTGNLFQAGITGQAPNTEYRVSVAAINGDGLATADAVLGSTFTLAKPPASPQVLGTTFSTIDLSWTANGNPSYTAYRVVISSDAFMTTVSTPIQFSSNYTATSAALQGLLTSTTYTIRITARNQAGIETASALTTGFTSNGGGPPGSLAIPVSPGSVVDLSGTILSGRSIGVRVLPNTFPQSVTLFVSSRPAVAKCRNPAGLDAAVDVASSPGLQPAQPLELRISFTAADVAGVNLSRLAIVRYDAATGACAPLKTRVDAAAMIASAEVNHLSAFQLQQIDPSSTVDQVRAFPNPLTVRTQSFMTFDGLPAGARVRIFTLKGEELFDEKANASGILTWPAVNRNRRPAASGIYIVVVEAGGTRKTMKVAVIR